MAELHLILPDDPLQIYAVMYKHTNILRLLFIGNKKV